MATKMLNTRIQLKYDSYAKWTEVNPTLLKGEIAIAYLGPAKTTADPDNGTHPVLFKVGPGQFNSLPWASALAADVHAWAKADKKPTYTADEIEGLAAYIGGKVQDTDVNNVYAFDIVDGKLQVTETVYNLGVAGNSTTTTYDFVTPNELTEILKDYYTKTEVDALIQGAKDYADGIDTGVHSVSLASGTNDKTLKLTVDGNVTDNIEVTNIYSKSEVDALVQGAKDHADNNDANETFAISYVKEDGKIYLTGSEGTNSEIPVADFVKDGMIDSVALSEDGKSLIITWNTDAGKDEISLPLSALVDIYTGVDGTTVKVEVSSDNKISAEVKTNSLKDGHIASDAAIAKSKLASDVQESLTKADNAAPQATTYNKSEVDGLIAEAKKYADDNDSDTTYSAKADGGLKLEGTEFSIDDALTFVFNCGDANGNPLA